MEIFEDQLKDLGIAELRLARRILQALLLKAQQSEEIEHIEKGIQEINR